MRYIVSILFCLELSLGFSQKILEINYHSLFGKEKSFQFFNNSPIDYKLKGDLFYKTHKLPYSKMTSFEKIFLLGVGITNAKEQEVLEFIYTGLQNSSEKYYIVTPNPELLVLANNNPEYKSILNKAKLALPDGIGVMWGAWFMGIPLQQRITGVDLVKSLCNYVSKRPITVGFLGAGPNVAEKTAECLQKLYPGLRVGLVSQEWTGELKNLPAGRQGKKVDILFIAFGSPKQEIWISEHLGDLPAKVVIGVGGAFDFISGKVPRAPEVLRRLGLEWLFRLVIQPWRIMRQLSLIKFVLLVFKEKFKI